MRPRITKPTLIRSTNCATNGKIVRDAIRHGKRVKKTHADGVFLKDAFGVRNRFIYIGM